MSIYYEPPLTPAFAAALRATHPTDTAPQELSSDLASTLNWHLFCSKITGETLLYLRNPIIAFITIELTRNPQLRIGVFSEDGPAPCLYQYLDGQLREVWRDSPVHMPEQTEKN